MSIYMCKIYNILQLRDRENICICMGSNVYDPQAGAGCERLSIGH